MMKKNFIFLIPIIILIFYIFGCSSPKSNNLASSDPGEKSAKDYYFKNIQVIDHWNLRYHKRYDIFSLNDQVSQIKANMDVASELGFNSYLLFQKDAFQELLTWGGKHEPDQDLIIAIKEVIAYGKQKGLDVYLHSNQFAWPDDVGVDYKDSKEAWQVYENAMKELIDTFPDVAGYQVTGDETEGQLDTKEGLLKFHNLTARALKSDGRERIAFMRTWQRCEFLGVPEKELGVGDEPNLVYSIKNTKGDFNITNGLDTEFIKKGVDGTRILVEFDAWREYETHNIFPIYLGDYWAPRFKAVADAGITSVGVRFNWNSGRFPVIDKNRPWANWINIYTFHRFVQNPYANPDDILMDFCKQYFPEDSVAAFNMYKNTFDFVKAVYYKNGEKYLHHGGLERPRGTPVDIDKVTQAYDKMKQLIDLLPESGQFKKDLQKYCLIISYLGRTAAGDKSVVKDWENLDHESFEELAAHNAGKW
ncbi:MAG: hypothetical protein JXR66_01340 [Bacteroidales bacterium]|nr:hypothetical protein [Bacteroidales bacterium]